MCESFVRYVMMTAFVVSLIIHGLVSEGGVGQTRKTVSVEVSPTGSLLRSLAPKTTPESKLPVAQSPAKADDAPVANGNMTGGVASKLDNGATSSAKLNETVHLENDAKNVTGLAVPNEEGKIIPLEGSSSDTSTTVEAQDMKTEVSTDAAIPAANSEEKAIEDASKTTTEKSNESGINPNPTNAPETDPNAESTESTVSTETSVTTKSTPESSTSSTGTTETSQQTQASENNMDPGMSSGIIALVMAIVFAVLVILVYVGLLLWRRYLEFRYGNRELLVNDLEFDTNDLRHFEL